MLNCARVAGEVVYPTALEVCLLKAKQGARLLALLFLLLLDSCLLQNPLTLCLVPSCLPCMRQHSPRVKGAEGVGGLSWVLPTWE